MMGKIKKISQEFFKGGMFITIGGYTIDFPFPNKWAGMKTFFSDVQGIIDLLVILSSVVAIVMIIVSGYTLITSTGNPDKVKQGQDTLTAALIGLVIVWIAGLIVKSILSILGVQ
jgi:type IV secretory pathway VirB2 component (pilin)